MKRPLLYCEQSVVSEQFLKQLIYAARKFPSQPAHFKPNDHELT